MNILKNSMLEQGYWMNSSNNKVLILSGGLGKRYGTPKALAAYKGETFLDSIVSKCLSLNLQVYVVINPTLDSLIPQKRDFITIIGDSDKDMYDSVIKGVKRIKEFSKLIVWPVDHPFVSSTTVKSLLDTNNDNKFIVPSFCGRLGHPVIFPKSAEALLKKLQNLKDLTHAIGRIILEVDDEGVLLNINRKEDIPSR